MTARTARHRRKERKEKAMPDPGGLLFRVARPGGAHAMDFREPPARRSSMKVFQDIGGGKL